MGNDYCSEFITGDCNKEITAVCGRFQVEVELYEPYMMFGVAVPVDVDNGSGDWYTLQPGDSLVVSARDDGIDDPNKTYRMKIKSDEIVTWIKFVSDTYKTITFTSADDLITAEDMCNGLTKLKNFRLNGFNQIVNFDNMFYQCHSLIYVNNFFVLKEDFNGPVQNTMQSMFGECKSLITAPSIDYSLSINYNAMFYQAFKMVNIPSILNKYEATAHTMFAGTSLTKMIYMNYDKLTDVHAMFAWMSSLEYTININFAIATDVSRLFDHCAKLKTVGHIYTPVATSMDAMYKDCISLKCIDLVDTGDANVPVADLFTNTPHLQIPLPAVQDQLVLGNYFKNNLNCPPIGSDKTFEIRIAYTGDIRDIQFIADADVIVDWGNSTHCGNTETDIRTEGIFDNTFTPDNCNIISGRKYYISEGSETYAYKAGEPIQYNGAYDVVNEVISIWSPAKLTTITSSANNVITHFNIIKASDLSTFANMCTDNTALTYFDIGPMVDYKNITDASHMFQGCIALEKQNINFKYLEDISYMFEGCVAYQANTYQMLSVDLSNIKIMDYAFKNCRNILSIMNTSDSTTQITSMAGTFDGCVRLKYIYDIYTDNVTNMNATFRNTILEKIPENTVFDSCTNFNETFSGMSELLCIKNIDTTSGTVLTDTFKDCDNLIYPSPTERDLLTAVGGYDYDISTCDLDISTSEFQLALELSLTSSTTFNFTFDNDFVVKYQQELDRTSILTKDTYKVYKKNDIAVIDLAATPRIAVAVLIAEINQSSSGTTFRVYDNDIVTYADLIEYDHLTSYENAFMNNINIKHMYVRTNNVANIDHMLDGCISMETISFRHKVADTITTAAYAFNNCSRLYEIAGLSLVNATDINHAFYNCNAYEGEVQAYSVPKATDISWAFTHTKVKELPLIDTDKVTDGRYAYADTLINGSINFDMPLLEDADGVFQDCFYISNINTVSALNTVESYYKFVKNCKSLIGIGDVGSTSCLNFNDMFYGCELLTCSDAINTTATGATKENMFYNTPSLYAPAASDITNLTSAAGDNWTNAGSCPPELQFEMYVTTSVEPDITVTGGAVTITAVEGGVYVVHSYDALDSIKFSSVSSANQYVTEVIITKAKNVKSFDSLFYASSGYSLKNMHTCSIEVGADTSSLVDTGGMFAGCTSLTTLKLSGLDTSSVTSMGWMFSSVSNLKILDCSIFNTSNVTSMKYMFYRMHAATSINVTSFDTSNVTTMEGMFGESHKLTAIDLSGFDTSSVTTMKNMFSGCSAVESIQFNTTSNMYNSLTTVQELFADCDNLVCINHFDTSNGPDTLDMFAECDSLTAPDDIEQDSIEAGLNWTNSSSCP